MVWHSIQGRGVVSHTGRGSLLLSSLDWCGIGSSGSGGLGGGGGRRSLLGGDRDGLLFLGHCDWGLVLGEGNWVSLKTKN